MFFLQDEEYVFQCSSLYYAATPIAVLILTIVILIMVVVCIMCRRQRKIEREEKYKSRYSNRSFTVSLDPRLPTPVEGGEMSNIVVVPRTTQPTDNRKESRGGARRKTNIFASRMRSRQELVIKTAVQLKY